MKKHLCLFITAFFSLCIYAQEGHEKFKDKFDDVFEEEENQNLTLRFFNALTGDPIEGAIVSIEDLGEYTSDAEGKVRFPITEDGFLKIHFECPKYIDSDFKAEVIASTLFSNRFSVSPMLDLKDVRIVLDWDQSPKDLDAHFIKDGSYHISYRNTRILTDGSGELDRDDMDGYGPETITIRDIDNLAEYNYIVQDYTNKGNDGSSGLASSKAHVSVYGEGRLLYTFRIPQGTRGSKWAVFQIKEGQFIEINQIF
ncbi:MAG: hypothetical protein PF517_19620 [Salinivirgaceae bacterium]|jgi:hypothetical protein|nr:hypothetical protein [Salinivirgaceae bacterium]